MQNRAEVPPESLHLTQPGIGLHFSETSLVVSVIYFGDSYLGVLLGTHLPKTIISPSPHLEPLGLSSGRQLLFDYLSKESCLCRLAI